MDAVDIEILNALQADAHTTQGQIARRVGLSQPSVADRVRKLEEARVITGYVARVDPKRLGLDITAFISVDIEHPKYFDGFARRVSAMAEVLECHRVAGDESYVLKIRTKNTGTLDRLLVERLRMIPGVTRSHTTIVLASVKEEMRVDPAGALDADDETNNQEKGGAS